MGSLLMIVAACNYNYALQPNTPVSNLRLKRLVYTNPIGFGVTTEYAYDQGGRVVRATFTGDFDYIINPTPDGPPYALFTYDADNRLVSYEYHYALAQSGYTGELTSFTNTAGSVATSTYKSGPNQPNVLLLKTISTFTDGKIMTYQRERFAGGKATSIMLGRLQREEYTYAGDNIASARITGDNPSDEQTYMYTYDDGPNPLRGFFGLDITPVRRYSMNNAIRSSIQEKDGPVRSGFTIVYEYGTNRLPVKAVGGGVNNSFDYESY